MAQVTCTCGDRLSAGQLENHKRGPWHRVARAARELRRAGLSYSEIAAELERRGERISRCRLHQKLSKPGA